GGPDRAGCRHPALRAGRAAQRHGRCRLVRRGRPGGDRARVEPVGGASRDRPGRCIAGRRARRGRLRGGPGRSARWCVRAAARQEDSRRSVHRLSMPFTPSHAVVALPFVRTLLVPAAIAIGAMTPDLPLFLRGFGVSYSFTHTLANVLWTAVIAAVLFLVWRAVLRPAV